MTTIQNLPELVIIGILKDGVKDLTPNLLYLSICHQWRCLALPLVHNSLVTQYFNRELEHDDDIENKFSSNISLLTSINCKSRVKQLKIHWVSKTFLEFWVH